MLKFCINWPIELNTLINLINRFIVNVVKNICFKYCYLLAQKTRLMCKLPFLAGYKCNNAGYMFGMRLNKSFVTLTSFLVFVLYGRS